jgi:hypothetical protein
MPWKLPNAIAQSADDLLSYSRIGQGSAFQALYSPLNHAREFFAVIRCAVLAQTPFGFFRRKPGRRSARFLGRVQPQNLAKMSGHDLRNLGRLPSAAPFGTNIAREGCYFHPAVDARFFKSFQGCGLSGCQSGFGASFGKGPAPAACLHQKEFDLPVPEPVADCRDLFASAQTT